MELEAGLQEEFIEEEFIYEVSIPIYNKDNGDQDSLQYTLTAPNFFGMFPIIVNTLIDIDFLGLHWTNKPKDPNEEIELNGQQDKQWELQEEPEAEQEEPRGPQTPIEELMAEVKTFPDLNLDLTIFVKYFLRERAPNTILHKVKFQDYNFTRNFNIVGTFMESIMPSCTVLGSFIYTTQ